MAKLGKFSAIHQPVTKVLKRRVRVSVSIGSGNMRSLLSLSGQTAYDAAAVDNWFAVSAADYAAVVSGLSSVTKYGLTDSQTAENGSGWSGGYAQAFPSTIGTVPANTYLIGFVSKTQNGGTTTPLISTTFRGTYTAIANSPSAAASSANGYFLRKPTTTTSATSYIGIVNSTTGLSTTTTFNPTVNERGGYDNTVPYSTWTPWTNQFLIFQMLGTPTNQWS